MLWAYSRFCLFTKAIIRQCAFAYAAAPLLAAFSMLVTFGAQTVNAQSVRITLTPDRPSPQLLGTSITWTAAIQNPAAGHIYDFRFSVGPRPVTLAVQRDFSLANTYVWTPHVREGIFAIQVIARDSFGGTTTVLRAVSQIYAILPRQPVSGAGVVIPTAHPLVALFAGPWCSLGNFERVRFQKAGSTASSTTSLSACNAATTMNFYIAGMLPSTQYLMRWETVSPGGSVINVGPQLQFITGSIPLGLNIPNFSVITPAPDTSQTFPVVLHGFLTLPKPYLFTATDLSGNVIWYYPTPTSFFGRLEAGGNMFVLQTASSDPRQQLLREIDLAGNTVLETNASIINEQLAARGQPPITGFHHEVRRILPSNNILLLAGRDVVSTSAQGGTPASPVDIIGDVVLVLDPNMQLLWSWDSFAHLDVNRAAILGETCTHGNAGCPPFNAAFAVANDWLHSNSVQFAAADGNLILSMRHQDWAIKINYSNGTGDGSVLWRLGNGGDFNIVGGSTPCTPAVTNEWFSHQHDVEFEFGDAVFGGIQVMTIFDNGNTRRQFCDPNANSRGQIVVMNEPGREVHFNQNADLGSYSSALGSAQLVTYANSSNASYDSGLIGGAPNGFSQTTEVDPNGNVVFNLQAAALTYRTFRLTDLYTPPTL